MNYSIVFEVHSTCPSDSSPDSTFWAILWNIWSPKAFLIYNTVQSSKTNHVSISSPVELRAFRSYVIQAQARHATRGAREILCEDLLKVTRICKWCEGRQKEEEWIYLIRQTQRWLDKKINQRKAFILECFVCFHLQIFATHGRMLRERFPFWRVLSEDPYPWPCDSSLRLLWLIPVTTYVHIYRHKKTWIMN